MACSCRLSPTSTTLAPASEPALLQVLGGTKFEVPLRAGNDTHRILLKSRDGTTLMTPVSVHTLRQFKVGAEAEFEQIIVDWRSPRDEVTGGVGEHVQSERAWNWFDKLRAVPVPREYGRWPRFSPGR